MSAHLYVAISIITYNHQNPMMNSKTAKCVGSLVDFPERVSNSETTESFIQGFSM